MNEHELLWDMLPDGLADHFTIESYEKTDEVFRITLVEKTLIPSELPEKYQGKKVHGYFQHGKRELFSVLKATRTGIQRSSCLPVPGTACLNLQTSGVNHKG